MIKINNLIPKIVLLILLLSCSPLEVDELYIQRIEGTPLVIYDYFASGGLDTMVSGYTIQDSTKIFKIYKIKELPISNFIEIPNNKRIETIHTVSPNDKTKISLNTFKKDSLLIDDLKVRFSIYERFQGTTIPSCNLTSYEFDSFTETNDSLFFFGLSKTWESSPDLPNGVSFKKGNIKLVGTKAGIVGRVVIEEFIRTLGVRKIYKYGSNELDRIEENKPIICVKSYYFNPRNELLKSEFSDYGVFKRIL